MKDDLPLEMVATAVRDGNEYGWRRNEVQATILMAKGKNLACLGGQVQFRLPDGTCELYWHCYDPPSQRNDENWQSYVERSNEEAFALFEQLPSDQELLDEAKEWPFLKAKMESGVNIEEYLIFILYFVTEKEYQALKVTSKSNG